MAVDKDKNDNIDDKYEECDSEDSSVVMSDIDEKGKSDAASILSQMNSDIMKNMRMPLLKFLIVYSSRNTLKISMRQKR
eukprot:13905439-Ditylum_brightwellii.AAC.1